MDEETVRKLLEPLHEEQPSGEYLRLLQKLQGMKKLFNDLEASHGHVYQSIVGFEKKLASVKEESLLKVRN